jgi:hypothetical protein
LQSRYVSHAVYFHIALYLLVLDLFFTEKRKFLSGALLGAILAVLGISAIDGYRDSGPMGMEYRLWREKGAYCLTHYRLLEDEDFTMFSKYSAQEFRDIAMFLEEHQLNVFARKTAGAETLEAKVPITASPLTGIDRSSYTAKSRAVVIESWAVDPIQKAAAGGVFVKVNGRSFDALYGIDRPDVAKRFGNARYKYSGFLAMVPRSAWKAGNNRVEFLVLTHDGKGYFLPFERSYKLP